MTLFCMVTVDLNKGVTEPARAAFYEYLRKEHWIRLKLTTTFWARFQESATVDTILRAAENEIAVAAAAAGIRYYEVAAQVGLHQPNVWDQSR
jgi:hypothetical protein